MTASARSLDLIAIRDRRGAVLTLLYSAYPRSVLRRTLRAQLASIYGDDVRAEIRRDLAYLEESGFVRSADGRRKKWRMGLVRICPSGIDVVEGAKEVPGVGPDIRSPRSGS